MDEYLRMLVEIKGAQALTDLQAQLANVGREQANLKALFDQGAITEKLLTAETQRLAAAKTELSAAVAGLSGGFGKYQQNITAAGYAVNDFASVSGGLDQRLNAIANNLPMVFAGLGQFGLALGAVVPILAAVYKNWDAIVSALGAGGQNEIPKSADAVKRLDDELKKVAHSLSEYAEKQKLTGAEVLEYNKLTERQIELEREKADEMRRQADLKELANLHPESQDARASAFKKAVGESGGGDRVDALLRQAIRNVADATGRGDVSLETVAKQAEDLLRGAAGGDKESRDAIGKFIRKGLPEDQQKFARNIDRFSPETKQNELIDKAFRDDAEAQDRKQAAKDAADERERQALNERGAENQRRAQAEQERAAEQARRNAPKEADAARLARIAGAVQQRGADAGVAQDVAPKIDKMMDLGLSFERALATVKAQREMEAAKLERLGLLQTANTENLMGAFGPAMARLEVLEGIIQGQAQQIQRLSAGVRKGGGNVGRVNQQPFPIQ